MEFNLATVFSAIARRVPERECVVFGDRRLTYAEVEERTDRLANFLLERGVTIQRGRDGLQPWESGQDHVAVYAYNGNEYLEVMLGAFKARAVPANVNYRYVEAELLHVLGDMRPKAIVVGGTFAPVLRGVLPSMPWVEVVVQVDDGSGQDLLPGAVDYEAIVASGPERRPAAAPSADDLYMLFTGGTTGLPKGVLWRHADLYVAALGGLNPVTRREFASISEIVTNAEAGGRVRFLPTSPFMHGAAHWTSIGALLKGERVVIPKVVERLDPADVWRCVEREKVTALLAVGDAMVRPLLDELRAGSYDASSLEVLVCGGAATNVSLKRALTDRLPRLRIWDSGGASETGGQLLHVSTRTEGLSTGTFTATPGTCVVDESKSEVLAPGHHGIGWLARGGRLPLGYLGDETKTRETFVQVGAERMAVPGDRARHLPDGSIELLGRESVTINSGGEKIFAEEVEQVLAGDPAVYDVVVCGRPSRRWGQEVVAIVALRPGAEVTDAELLARAGTRLARYKLPKAIVRRETIIRSPAGKADYRWARAQVDVVSASLEGES